MLRSRLKNNVIRKITIRRTDYLVIGPLCSMTKKVEVNTAWTASSIFLPVSDVFPPGLSVDDLTWVLFFRSTDYDRSYV